MTLWDSAGTEATDVSKTWEMTECLDRQRLHVEIERSPASGDRRSSSRAATLPIPGNPRPDRGISCPPRELFAGLRRNISMDTAPLNERPTTTRSKSPLEQARTAMAAAQEALPKYSSRFSRHDFTQHQLYALVTLRRLLKTDYRGLEATLRDWTELRDTLGLTRVPDHSTIQRAARRFKGKGKGTPTRRKEKPKPMPMPLFDQPNPVAGTAA
jgi:hypothetical protein